MLLGDSIWDFTEFTDSPAAVSLLWVVSLMLGVNTVAREMKDTTVLGTSGSPIVLRSCSATVDVCRVVGSKLPGTDLLALWTGYADVQMWL